VTFLYDASVSETAVRGLETHFCGLLRSVLEGTDVRHDECDVFGDEERRMLASFNESFYPYKPAESFS
jgi:hypothetical protein